MRVVRSTPTELEVLDPALWGRVLGVLLLLGGAGLGYLGVLNRAAGGTLGMGPGWVPLFVSVLFLAAGVSVFVVARTTRHRFDRTTGRVVVEARALGRATRHEFSLADIEDVVLETGSHEDTQGSRRTNYRVAYVLSTGEHLPWTPYYTGTRSDKAACIEAVRAFLGTGTVHEPPPGRST